LIFFKMMTVRIITGEQDLSKVYGPNDFYITTLGIALNCVLLKSTVQFPRAGMRSAWQARRSERQLAVYPRILRSSLRKQVLHTSCWCNSCGDSYCDSFHRHWENDWRAEPSGKIYWCPYCTPPDAVCFNCSKQKNQKSTDSLRHTFSIAGRNLNSNNTYKCDCETCLKGLCNCDYGGNWEALDNFDTVGVSQSYTYEVYRYATRGAIGKAFFVVWIIWCAFGWGGEGTERPAWGWLDWLG
jgi:hypothetical protein